ARRLVESITSASPAGSGPGPASQVYDREQVRLEVAVPSVGLFLTGLATLLSWILAFGSVALAQFDQTGAPHWFWPTVILAGSLLVPLSALIMTGAVMMRRLRWYPLVATAAILAMVPWSAGWLIGLVFGIWTCIILGKPEVVEAFHPSRAQAAPAAIPAAGAAIAGRFRSLLRSMGRYMLPTFLAARSPTSQTDGE